MAAALFELILLLAFVGAAARSVTQMPGCRLQYMPDPSALLTTNKGISAASFFLVSIRRNFFRFLPLTSSESYITVITRAII